MKYNRDNNELGACSEVLLIAFAAFCVLFVGFVMLGDSLMKMWDM